MDIATLLGLIMGTAVVIAAILVGSDLYIFINLPGFLIARVFIAFKVGLQAAFVPEKDDARGLVETSVALARRSRKDGILSLEGLRLKNAFFQRGIQLCVDGISADVIRRTLTSEMHETIRRHEEGARIFRGIGDAAPAFGMIGTLVGLVQMLANLKDPGAIGPAMAVAMLTTLYGALIANLIALPIADKLESRTSDEESIKSLIIESVLEIQAQTNPSVLGEMLESYLPEHQRGNLEEETNQNGEAP